MIICEFNNEDRLCLEKSHFAIVIHEVTPVVSVTVFFEDSNVGCAGASQFHEFKTARHKAERKE
ncbi:hypothetical protein [Thalassoglobus sp.]|uniref:hypothetical protein n=1 Tax=Thalassoglobus sp. TaxID=2795869 RepID=UPI003AA96BD6